MNNEIAKIWEKAAIGLPALKRGQNINFPKSINRYTLQELKEKKLLNNLAKAYCEVFGDNDIWNEGAYCSKEGRKKSISLQEYGERKNEKKLTCECGGIFKQFYPIKKIEKRINDEVKDTDNSILVLFTHENPIRVGGFIWGCVGNIEKIKHRIIAAHYSRMMQYGSLEMDLVAEALGKELDLRKRIVYIDEMGLTKNCRIGLNFNYLLRAVGEFSYFQRADNLFFWTAKKSPLYKLVFAYGCKIIHENSEGICYFLIQDLNNILRVLQNYDEQELKKLFSYIFFKIADQKE